MAEAQQMLDSMAAKGDLLTEQWANMPGKQIRGYESKKTVNFLEGIEDINRRRVISQLFENAAKTHAAMEEATRTLQVGSFEKFVFPLIRAVMANLVAAELVTVHALDAPTGLVFKKAA